MNRPALEGLRLNVPAYVKHTRLVEWVAQIAALTEASDVYWCDGSQAEYDRLTEQLVAAGTSWRHRPDPRRGRGIHRRPARQAAQINLTVMACG